MSRFAFFALLLILSPGCRQSPAATSQVVQTDNQDERRSLIAELNALMEEQRTVEASIAEKISWAESYETGSFIDIDKDGKPITKIQTEEDIAEDQARARSLREEAEALKLRREQIAERIQEINSRLDSV